MNNIHKSLLLLGLLGAGGLASCEKQLDINVDPTRPATVSPDLVLPAGTGNLAFIMGASFNILGNFFAQHWTESLTANQYKDYDRYRIGQTTNDRDYQTLFTGALKNFRYVIDRAKGDSSNYAAIAGLQSAYTYQVLTDGFDKVPFTESLLGAANTQPRFDEGPVVYDGVIQLINQSLQRINANGINVGSQDLIFAGNMDKWRRFGNTLKLKVFLREIYARPAAADSIRALYARGAQFLGATEDAQITGFSTANQNGNPLYLTDIYASSGIANNIIASETSINYLTTTNDPRIDDLFSRPGSTTAVPSTAPHVGTPQGDAIRGASGAISTRSRPNLQKIAGPASPVVLLSGAESLFLQAEAAHRGLTSGGDPLSLYNQAITASFQHLGTPTTRIDSVNGVQVVIPVLSNFLTSSPINLGNVTGESRLERIITQKWVALNGTEGFEAWTELRRTKYPSFITGTPFSDLPGRTYAKRLIYPFSEISRNANAPAVEQAQVPVWWDKK
ncbi:SusD/RagB family nutrient-binding outer membrane lipoprotein [Hymenobacter negativus]|uniref:SusD/RagB family nutrient-binding outer membrane lipoprotein n=1 Tax=Hymenobacter negativus TaxID=2795026 RepID=A0ABS3QD84_9BACT|nr:SusD/RagB family nutrient-binding outer membrane lipoprotein [Hymenobacter negativus]MBO2008784.1 SusD/RagB family nutrient-binding outer membrane lipoprotein [Hymenobacter negativus]